MAYHHRHTDSLVEIRHVQSIEGQSTRIPAPSRFVKTVTHLQEAVVHAGGQDHVIKTF